MSGREELQNPVSPAAISSIAAPAKVAYPTVSLIIPVLNESSTLPQLLENLAQLEGVHQVLFVDGGSTDRSMETVREAGYPLLESPRGRGVQLDAGAQVATGDILWFLHADTEVPSSSVIAIQAAVRDGNCLAGAFTLRFRGHSWSARWMTWLYARLRRVGLLYGDAGIFVQARLYRTVGGFPHWPLFEDQGFLRCLRRAGCRHIVCLSPTITTSSRRFEGWRFPLVFAQWVTLQVLFWFGVPPRWLGRRYPEVRTSP